jgi:hypothetical protein
VRNALCAHDLPPHVRSVSAVPYAHRGDGDIRARHRANVEGATGSTLSDQIG